MKKLFKYLLIYKVIFLILLTTILISSSFNIDLEFKIDSIIIVVGNLIIALIITGYLSKKHKKAELELDHCLKDISEIVLLLKELKEELNKITNENENENENEKLKREIISKTTIVGELITMLINHSLVNKKELTIIKEIHNQFETTLTETKNINDDWFDKILKLNRHLLKLKSSSIKAYRKK